MLSSHRGILLHAIPTRDELWCSIDGCGENGVADADISISMGDGVAPIRPELICVAREVPEAEGFFSREDVSAAAKVGGGVGESKVP